MTEPFQAVCMVGQEGPTLKMRLRYKVDTLAMVGLGPDLG